MDYKKKYKDALSRAKGMWEQGMMPERVEYIFPELKESDNKSNTMSLNSIVGFGKYKGETIGTLLMRIDGVKYLKWGLKENIFKLSKDALNKLNQYDCVKMCYNKKDFLKVYSRNDTINFGKHKGRTIDFLLSEGISYLKWLCRNQIICLDEECEQIIRSRTGFTIDNHLDNEYLGWDDEGLSCGALECDCY